MSRELARDLGNCGEKVCGNKHEKGHFTERTAGLDGFPGLQDDLRQAELEGIVGLRRDCNLQLAFGFS